MTLPNTPSPRAFLAGIVLSLAAGVTLAGDLSVAELMRVIGQTKEGKALFVEKKYIGMVDKPLVSSGELAFTAPDRLEKRTLKPVTESLILEGDNLTIEQADKRRFKLSLREHPEVAAFVESIRGTLSGDRQALESAYTLELTGVLDKWQLVLMPTQAQMSKLITRIRIGGVHGDVKAIIFEQADGDRSEMAISKVSPK